MFKNFSTKFLAIAALGISLTGASIAQPLNLQDVGTAVHGGNPLEPTADSLVGQYLASTNAATVVRTFPNGPGGAEGVEKLAVALSPQSFNEFLRIFGSGSNLSKNLFFVHHYPQSNTFYFVYKGKLGSYARTTQNAAFHSVGTLVIPILLDDAEAGRLEKFLALAAIHETFARSPWKLTGSDGTYSTSSAFQGCTNWVGQMPLGSKTVTRYIFPSGDNGEMPNVQALLRYSDPVNMSPDNVALLRSVWKVPGHQQFGDMLYPEGYRAGEFTNVGWIAHVTLGRLDLDRVPFMFYEVADHTAPLAANFPLLTRPQ